MKVQKERLQELLALLMEQGLDEAGQVELAGALESDPKLAGEALELWQQESRIRYALTAASDPESKVAPLLSALRSGLPETESHVRTVLARVGAKKGRRAKRYVRPGWAVPAAVAACVLIGIAALIVSSPSPSSRPARPSESARAPKDVEPAPTPPQPEPKVIPPATPPKPREPKEEEPAPKSTESLKPAPRPVPEPERKPKSPENPSTTPVPAATTPAFATLERVEGGVTVLTAVGNVPAKVGEVILSGQGLEVGTAARAVLKFPDGTRIDSGPDTRVKEFANGAGKRIQLQKGTLSAEVVKQPAGKPLVFTTPQGEATVLGTTLRLTVDATSTRLEVTEGKVRLKRVSDGKAVEVASGHFAVAATGIDLAPRLLPIEEIVLASVDGTRFGQEWRRVKDEKTLSGESLEALETANLPPRSPAKSPEEVQAGIRARQEWFAKGKSRSWVAFTFQAEANKEYFVWVRGACRWTGKDRELHDAVMIQVSRGRFVNRPGDWPQYSDELCVFGGFAEHEGYWWSGGQHDTGSTPTPVSVRFDASGRQTLLMHAAETPLRIDAIWLSTTQRDRPDPQSFGPARR